MRPLRQAQAVVRAADRRGAHVRGRTNADTVRNLHLRGRPAPLLQTGPLAKLAERHPPQPDIEQVFYKSSPSGLRRPRIFLAPGRRC